MKRLMTLTWLALLSGTLAFAQTATTTQTTQSTDQSTSTDTTTKAKKRKAKKDAAANADQSKSDMSAAGSETGSAAKDAGKGVAKGAKAVGNKTKEGYEATKDKLTPSDKKTDTSAAPATTTTTTSSSTTTTKSKPSAASSAAASGDKLDINTASTSDLTKLQGIDSAKAQKIISNRPYRAKNQLVSKGILSKDEYEAIKEQIIAHHVK